MGTASVREIQQALKDKGFDPGGIDGVWGRKTIAAVKQFQAQQGLSVDGMVGPNTKAVLFGNTTSAPVAVGVAVADGSILPWFEEAKHLMGTREVAGKKNNNAVDTILLRIGLLKRFFGLRLGESSRSVHLIDKRSIAKVGANLHGGKKSVNKKACKEGFHRR